MLDDISPSFRDLVTNAAQEWFPESKVTLLKELGGGKSGAYVFVVDINPSEVRIPAGNLSGHFILKLDELKSWGMPEPNEKERHLEAIEYNQIFARKHIPKLIHYFEQDKKTALLYEIAGLSLHNITTIGSLDGNSLKYHTSRLFSSLLVDFNSGYTVESGISQRQSLEEWLGYRLNEDEAPGLYEFVRRETEDKHIFILGQRILFNPLSFCHNEVIIKDKSNSRFMGLIHGDLHQENFLLNKHNTESDDFWLIDFALSKKAPLFYDQAYFELSLLLKHLSGTEPERILNLIDALDAEANNPVPVADMGLLSCLRSMRVASDEWQQTSEPRRKDTFISQQLLAQIAVSLNWINKKLKDSDKRLALAYGASAAKKYLNLFHNKELLKYLNDTKDYTEINSNETVYRQQNTQDSHLWSKVWESMDGFDESRSNFVLITGALSRNIDNASVGFLPWSAIVDLDPESDASGLHYSASPVLKNFRSLKTFGINPQLPNFEKGTAWLMANGWKSHNEPIPETLKIWRNLYLQSIHDLCVSIKHSVAPQITKILVLPGSGLDNGRLSRVLETIDNVFQDLGQIILLGDNQLEDSELLHDQINILPEHFTAGIRSVFGTRGEVKDSEIPGVNGPVPISLDKLRNLEEDFDLLHSKVLIENSTQQNQSNFWRGSAPTWSDLHQREDVKRSIHPTLVNKLVEFLEESKIKILELHHSPGAGGTTAALRAVWDLRTKYPSIILRRLSKLTADRIDDVFQIAQSPVLILADASVISSTARDELLRELSARNSRVVLLYVTRTLLNLNNEFSLITPMADKNEIDNFYELFSSATEDSLKKKQLKEISFSEDKKWEAYRSPFFYGLITYDREFTTVSKYVKAYLEEAGYKVRKVIGYLALVTCYSQAEISQSFFYRLLGINTNSQVALEETLGVGPRQLIVQQNNKLRLLHPLIAEEVLKQLLGTQSEDQWLYGLKDFVIDFINEIDRILGSDSEEAEKLLEHLFIRRNFWLKRRERFAEVINAIPTPAGQYQVFQLLTEIQPQNAHFWNHLGRHHIYEMKEDFEVAEQYLEKAVSLEPNESIHHHSLGMVRRFWIEDRIKKIIRESSNPIPAIRILAEVKDLTESACQAFHESRRLNPQNEHAYTTQIQLVLKVIERLLNSSGTQTVTDENKIDRQVSRWIRSNLVVAESLLAQFQHLRADKSPDTYEVKSVTKLNLIYGNFDETIKMWTTSLKTADEPVELRRAIVQAYYTKRNRKWSKLSSSELQLIVDLLDKNLQENPNNEHDIRTWFQAYRRLPEFSYIQALDKLQSWANQSSTLDAYYYLYILHFLRWFYNKEMSEDSIEENLIQSQNLSIGTRGYSYEWFAVEPLWCPLVSSKDLGDFDRQRGFYTDTDELEFCMGTVEVIRGPKAGIIRIGQKTRAFFVPGTKFRAAQHINAVVHFYLGFAYDGLRAWEVDFGEIPVEKIKARISQKATAKSEANSVSLLSRFQDKSKEELLNLREQVKAFVINKIDNLERDTSGVLIAKLGNDLKSKFPGRQVHIQLGYNSLQTLLNSYEEFIIKGDDKREFVYKITSS